MSDETEVIKEAAKAAQELAKVTSKGIDAGREMGGFVAKFVSGPLQQASGIIEDKLRYVRWERQQRLIKKANEYLAEHGLPDPDKPLPWKTALPLLQYATIEEDNDLQDMWARLLVNGTSTSSGLSIERSFVEILGQISPLEAKILTAIYSLPFEETLHGGIVTESLPNAASVADEKKLNEYTDPSEDIKLALASLARLGCVKFRLSWGGGEIYNCVNPTLIGHRFVEACTLKNS